MFSQGMADVLLDACSDFWDGRDVRPLGTEERYAPRSFEPAFTILKLIDCVADCVNANRNAISCFHSIC